MIDYRTTSTRVANGPPANSPPGWRITNRERLIAHYFCYHFGRYKSACNVDGPTAHCSDDDSLVRKPISPTAHWSGNPLVRKSVISPKTHWSDGPLVRRPLVRKCHWSKNVGTVQTAVYCQTVEFLFASGLLVTGKTDKLSNNTYGAGNKLVL